MSLRCKIFGHKLERGYAGSNPYLRIGSSTVDGIGRKHAFLQGRCERCDEWFYVANLHLPGAEKSIDEKA